MGKLRDLLEMIRFSHTIFALPFALLAAVMAWTAETPGEESVSFQWFHLVGILICMVGARSAAMTFNRIADRLIDAENPRTAQRHIPAGKVSLATAMTFLIASIAIFFTGTALFLPNWLPVAVGIPVLAVLLGYSYAKRFTSLAHFWLGVALMLAPICTWLGVRGLIVMSHPLDVMPAVMLGLVVLFWVSGFDMIYACQDYEYDCEKKLNSVPVRLGIAGALRLAGICHGIMMLILIALPLIGVGPDLSLGWLYWTTVAGIGGLLVYQHSLVRPDDLTRVNIAFFNVNAILSFGLFVLGSIDLLVI
jgi:4-hydroxybenzoate polyprenyltransferase